MIRRGLAALGMFLVLVSAAGAFGPGRFGLMPTQGPVAFVEGAIVPCSMTRNSHPAYAAGTVTVAQYPINEIDPGFSPPRMVAEQTVGPNGVYRFVLDPGYDYTISSGDAFTSVQLNAGDDVRADLQEPCL